MSKKWGSWAFASLAFAALFGIGQVQAATFTVDVTSVDSRDADRTDGQCISEAGGCTIRAAVEQANQLPGTDTIIVPASTVPYPINWATAAARVPLIVHDSLNLMGEGAERSIIDGLSANPILWVEAAEMLVLDVAPESVDQGFVLRMGYHGEQATEPFVETGRLNWDSRIRLIPDNIDETEDEMLVTTRTEGVLRFSSESGEFLGVAVPPTWSGDVLDVSDVALGPDGLLYATRTNGGEVMRFDYLTGTLQDVFIVGGDFASRSLLWWPMDGGHRLFVTRFGDSVIRRYDTSGNLVDSIETGFQDIADFAISGTTIYVATGSDSSVHRFGLTAGENQGQFVPPGSGGLDGALFLTFGPDNWLHEYPELYVTSSGSNQILRYDTRNGQFLGVYTQGDTDSVDTVGAIVFRSDSHVQRGPEVTVQQLTLANGTQFNSGYPTAGLRVSRGARVTLSDCSIRDMDSRVWGGGISNDGGDLIVRRSSITNCTLPQGNGGQTSTGGGIFNAGTLTVEDSLVAGNRAGKGGGIAQRRMADFPFHPQSEIINTTIAENLSDGDGGGVRVVGGLMRISFSTITRNETEFSGDEPRPWGGGILIEDDGYVIMGNTILAGNFLARQTVPLRDPVPNDCFAPAPLLFNSQRNLIIGVMEADCQPRDGLTGELDGILFGTSPTNPLDPGLSDELGDYGGPTLTYLPEPGSLAIDGDVDGVLVPGDSLLEFFACGDHDQRQQPRPVDGDSSGVGQCDIGAVEVLPVLASDIDADGIANDVDASPSEFSFVFSNEALDGSAHGEIVSAGAQLVSVQAADPPSSGVIVSADPSGGAEPAVIVACGGLVVVELQAGESTIISCTVADAGPDQTLECADGGAFVTLDGSGSSAGTGTTTYAWSAPGVTLANADQVVATGTFPLGTKTASLTVAAGSDSSTDTAEITVVDTTPPVLNIPGDVSAKTCGAVALGQASAADSCGGTVTISNNAPATFKAGVHVVTWTATDARGHTTQKQQIVTVGLGNSTSCCPSGTNVIAGNSSNNTLTGTAGRDCIVGMGGQDTINGQGGNDVIGGGDGNDVLDGGNGDDFIDGGTGQDTLRGRAGADVLFGSDGDDQCFGGDQADVLRGGQGQDQLFGENGNDALFGDSGDDTLWGGNDNDSLNGGGLHDQCDGQAGSNTFLLCDNQPNAPGPLGASFAITDDWGGGFCVGLTVTNPNATDATDIAVVFNLPDGTIYTYWNGVLNGTRGVVTIMPSMSFNQSLYPGEVDTTMGFCVTRDNPWSGAPVVLTTSATLE
jgi:Ca2+-binding RTX toxin-like protein